MKRNWLSVLLCLLLPLGVGAQVLTVESVSIATASDEAAGESGSARRTAAGVDLNQWENYLWVSVSPDGTKVLYYDEGRGVYVASLNSDDLWRVCDDDLHAPVWYNDEIVIGMADEDDGEVITASKIVACSLTDGAKQELTGADRIALYPTVVGGEIRFHNEADVPYRMVVSPLEGKQEAVRPFGIAKARRMAPVGTDCDIYTSLSCRTFAPSSAEANGPLAGKYIYLNPGHGSWGPNDRPMGTIPYPLQSSGLPDTCGFYESNTDLWKMEALRDYLVAAGATVIMSRVKNGPYSGNPTNPYDSGTDKARYNRSLTVICEEVEKGYTPAGHDYDMFFSLHSNAATDGTMTNYPLMLYRGTDAAESVAGSKNMAVALWDTHVEYMQKGLETQTNFTTKRYVKGDISFYGSSSTRTSAYSGKSYTGYLGVLKHKAPGFLAEGFFHTYQPARHRALNRDFCRQEGVRYFRGILSYYGKPAMATGAIMGVVKDNTQTMNHSLYTYSAGTHDQYVPLNGAEVRLRKADGTVVGTYTIDQNSNGIFVFPDLEPGEYMLDVKKEGYVTQNRVVPASVDGTQSSVCTMTVSANQTTYPIVYMSTVGTMTDFESGEDAPVDLTHFGTVKAVEGATLSELTGKTIRRVLYRDGLLYALAWENAAEPHVYIYRASTQTPVQDIDCSGLLAPSGYSTYTANLYRLSDIAITSDGVLIGCNKEVVGNASGNSPNYQRIYRFEPNGDGTYAAPALWFEARYNSSSGYWTNAYAGESMAYQGTSTAGNLAVTTVSPGGYVRYCVYHIANGTYTSGARDPEKYDAALYGSNGPTIAGNIGTPIVLTPEAGKDEGSFLTEGSAVLPHRWQYLPYVSGSGTATAITPVYTTAAAAEASAFGGTEFMVTDKVYYVSPVHSASGTVTGVRVSDVSNFSTPAAITIDNASITAATGVTYEAAFGTYEDGKLTLTMVLNDQVYIWTTPDDLTYFKTVKVVDNAPLSALTGKTIRRVLYRDGLLYALAWENVAEPHVYIYRASTQSLVQDIDCSSLPAPSGYSSYTANLYRLSDIAITSDGVLIGCNKEVVGNASGNSPNYQRIYRFEPNGDGTYAAPALWFEARYNSSSGYWTNAYAGESMAYQGTSTAGNLAVTTVSPGGYVRYCVYHISEGGYASGARDPQKYDSSVYGTNGPTIAGKIGAPIVLTPEVMSLDGSFLTEGSIVMPHRWQWSDYQSGTATATPFVPTFMAETAADAAAWGGTEFEVASMAYYISPIHTDAHTVTGIRVSNVSDMENPSKVTVENSTISPVSSVSYEAAFGVCEDGVLTLFLVLNDRLYIWSTTVFVTGVSLSSEAETMTVGSEIRLYPTVAPAEGSDKSVIWSSSNTEVAVVSAEGVVTAVTAGEAVVTCTSVTNASASAVCTITVEEPEPEPDMQLTLVAQLEDDYYATFSSSDAVQFTDEQTQIYAVMLDATDPTMIVLSELADRTVPANSGVLLKSSEQLATCRRVESASPIANNMLHPASEAMTGNSKFYRLAYYDYDAKTGLGFYYGPNCPNGEPFACKAGTAYLAVPDGNAVALRYLISPDEQEDLSEHPGTVTELEKTEEEPDCRIFLQNGQLLIRRGEQIYDNSGRKIR